MRRPVPPAVPRPAPRSPPHAPPPAATAAAVPPPATLSGDMLPPALSLPPLSPLSRTLVSNWTPGWSLGCDAASLCCREAASCASVGCAAGAAALKCAFSSASGCPSRYNRHMACHFVDAATSPCLVPLLLHETQLSVRRAGRCWIVASGCRHSRRIARCSADARSRWSARTDLC